MWLEWMVVPSGRLTGILCCVGCMLMRGASIGQKCPVAPVSAMDGMEGGEEPRLTGEGEVGQGSCAGNMQLFFTLLLFMFGVPLAYGRGTWTNTLGSSRLR